MVQSLLPALACALLLAGALGTQACSSYVVDCGDGAVVATRTLDFPGDLLPPSLAQFRPATLPYTALAVAKGGVQPTWNFKHGFVLAGLKLGRGINPLMVDGMNSQGLTLGVLWQSNVSFHHKYDPAAQQAPGAKAMALPDLPYYVLGNFASVAELREFLAPPGLLQLTTDLQNDAMAALIAAFFSQDPDVPPPDPGGTLYLPYHLHFTDAGGDALLLEATPDGGWAVFDTRVVTNEPAFPLLQQWVEEFTAFDWSAVPGTQPPPSLAPGIVPFNSAFDSSLTGYLGSMSRWLRLNMTLTNCREWPWQNGTFSPGDPGASADLPLGSFRALKRAENYLGSIIVPLSQLTLLSEYATQVSVLRDSTARVYYYRTPQNNQWSAIDLKRLENVSEARTFPLGLTHAPFAVDLTAGLPQQRR